MRLIDLLLNSPEYGRNWAKYWRDVVMFHATNENLNRVRFDAMESWLQPKTIPGHRGPGMKSFQG